MADRPFKAQLVYGDTESINYTTPETDVDPGAVVVSGTVAGVDVHGAPADSISALTHAGVFEVVKITETAFAVGDSVYWNATGDPQGGTAETGAATASAEDVLLGVCVEAATEDAQTVLVKLTQAVTAGSVTTTTTTTT